MPSALKLAASYKALRSRRHRAQAGQFSISRCQSLVRQRCSQVRPKLDRSESGYFPLGDLLDRRIKVCEWVQSQDRKEIALRDSSLPSQDTGRTRKEWARPV